MVHLFLSIPESSVLKSLTFLQKSENEKMVISVPVQILLATYNSAQYLRKQLDSLFAQDFQDFQLLIRDGGSQDHTLDIIREYQEKFPEKIRFLGCQKATALGNFSELLKTSEADVVMFCDHDDVWLPQKISHTLAKYRELEREYGKQTPIMIFTDSSVVDSQLKMTSVSMLKYQHLNPFHRTLNRLLVQNVSFGNTMLVNRALIDLALPIPAEAVMHDHWLSLTAAAFGKIGFLNETTLYYRQHERNVYGASKYDLPSMFRKLSAGKKKIRSRFEENIRQAIAFNERFHAELDRTDGDMLSALEQWSEYGFWKKRKILLKYHIFKSGFLRNLGMFILI